MYLKKVKGEHIVSDLWLVLVLACVIFGYAGNFFAKKTGRNTVLWTLLGVLISILILAAMIFVGGRSQKAKQYPR